MRIAREGFREIALASLVLAGAGALILWLVQPSLTGGSLIALPLGLVWLWVVSFFRDPPRRGDFQPGELCAAADGRVTEITDLEHDGTIGGPAVRIGVFLSIFNVHINRSPCAGRVRSVSHQPGEFLDARHPESGKRNESNTLVIEPDNPLPGPVLVRQVAGMIARRIICHAVPDQRLAIAERFGLIKFGSRTELIIPRLPETDILVSVGDTVRAGLTVLARQPAARRIEPTGPQPNEPAGMAQTAKDNPAGPKPAPTRSASA